MNPKLRAARSGVIRGGIELRQTFTNAQDLWGYLFPTAVLLAVMILMRGAEVPGADFSLGTRTLPSVLGANIAFTGLVSLAVILAIEREDGTLLRAKAVPNGMLGYLIGKIIVIGSMSVIGVLLILIPGTFLFDGLELGLPAWLTLAWVLLLGLVATMPLGAITGSLFSNPRNGSLIVIPILGLVAVSGIFYPITNYPAWLQWLAQFFPVYWLGLGMRSALLPPELAAVEIGGSWRYLETAGVLGVWAIAGLVIAPVILRRMARRESGSVIAARRQKALQRVA
jgi:ABC-2 type transport system permease protein